MYKRLTFICFLLIISSFTEASQNTALNSSNLFELTLEELLNIKVSTASRTEERAIQAPAKIKIITRSQIRSRGYINLYDLLKDQVGIDTQSYSHETTYNHVAIRGAVGNNRFLILQDGMRINSPAGDSIAISDNFPLFNAQRVEIVYGPASALYGTDAFTGVINIITFNEKNESQAGFYAAEYGYRSLYANTQFNIADTSRLSIAFHKHQAENPDLSKYYPEIFDLQDLVRFDGSVALPANQRKGYYGNTESDSLSLKLNIQKNFTLGFHQSRFASPTSTGIEPNLVNYGSQSDWKTTLGNVYANFDHQFDARLTMRISLSHQYYEVDESSKFNNIFSNFDDGYKYSDVDKSQLELKFDYQISDKQQLIVGYNSEHYTALPKTTDLATPYDPDKSADEQSFFYGGTNDNIPVKIFESRYTNIGAFAHYRHQFLDSLDGILGIRYDNNSRFGDTLNPRTGLIITPNGRLTVKLLYGEAFLAPAPELTYEHFGAFSGETDIQGNYTSVFFFIPNPELKPETVKTFEANLTYIVNQDLVIDASVYRSDISDFIINSETPIPVTDFIAGGAIGFTSQNVNAGNVEILGADFEINYQADLDNSSLNIWANYSYLDGNLIDKTGNVEVPAPFTSKHKFKTGLTYRYNRDYFISSNLHWIDKASTDTSSIDAGSVKSTTADRYFVIGLNAGIDNILPDLSINVKVENLTDKRYFNAGTGVNITFSESPQNPRIITLGLNYQY
jgi:iron complex outermembrane receptor protein